MLTLTLTPDVSGRIPTDQLADVAEAASAGRPTVYLGIHGLGTNASGAASITDDFLVGMDCRRVERGIAEPDALVILLHWPSAVSENQGSPLNLLDAAAYWAKETLADLIGKTALADIIETILIHCPSPVDFVLIGHSFGTKVEMSGLAELVRRKVSILPNVRFHATLLQAAFPHDSLQAENCYGPARSLPLNLTIYHSDLDKALGTWFPAARLLEGKPARALGFAGPTVQTFADWGGGRLVVDDLTTAHRNRDVEPWLSDPGGHHGDVMLPCVFDAVLDLTF